MNINFTIQYINVIYWVFIDSPLVMDTYYELFHLYLY